MVNLAVLGLFLTYGPGPGMAGRFHDAGEGGWGLDLHEIESENGGGRGLIVEARMASSSIFFHRDGLAGLSGGG